MFIYLVLKQIMCWIFCSLSLISVTSKVGYQDLPHFDVCIPRGREIWLYSL